ncbi:uncharacterized protein LOC143460640 isoform X3 [Clavelina lepadiformis]|uniref:uncharacterized protein LOC143460640 isoform X3 n=1 Tax=Clavelina lepadiformis TaxID=159417 RepID=UPI00404114BB
MCSIFNLELVWLSLFSQITTGYHCKMVGVTRCSAVATSKTRLSRMPELANGGRSSVANSTIKSSAIKPSLSGIPRLGAGQGIRKMVLNGGVTKSKNRLKSKSNALSLSAREPPQRPSDKLHLNKDTKSTQQTSGFTQKSSTGPIFKEIVPLPKKNRNAERAALSNLSNSPRIKAAHTKPCAAVNKEFVVSLSKAKPCRADVKKVEERETVSGDEKSIYEGGELSDFDFKADPDALESILNNEGITQALMQKKISGVEQSQKGEPKANTLLLPDGRPSLCRRVPIKLSATSEHRMSMGGPKRVLSGKKVTSRMSCAGQKKSFIKPLTGSFRHSLYSVVQGRYTQHNDNKTLQGRQSFLSDFSKRCPKKELEVNKMNHTASNVPPVSPAVQRILKQRDEARISASPAFRVPKPKTPTPRRVPKKGNKRGVKWADENSPCIRKNLAAHFLQDSPANKSPERPILIKTPVSILKSRKHCKRNSLTPPMKKKDKFEFTKKENKDPDDVVIEVVSPQVINDKQSEPDNVKSKAQTQSDVESLNPATQQNAVEVNQVLKILNRHVSSVKRRSVQTELSKVMQNIATSLNLPSLKYDVIDEEDEVANDSTQIKISEKNKIGAVQEKTSPTHTAIPLAMNVTPESIQDIRENGDEEENKSLDEIALETERINKELEFLKLQKEKLNAFQEQVKNHSRESMYRRANATKSVAAVSNPVLSEKLPVQCSSVKSLQPKGTNSNELCNNSWEKILKSEMDSSPKIELSEKNLHSKVDDTAGRVMQTKALHISPPANANQQRAENNSSKSITNQDVNQLPNSTEPSLDYPDKVTGAVNDNAYSIINEAMDKYANLFNNARQHLTSLSNKKLQEGPVLAKSNTFAEASMNNILPKSNKAAEHYSLPSTTPIVKYFSQTKFPISTSSPNDCSTSNSSSSSSLFGRSSKLDTSAVTTIESHMNFKTFSSSNSPGSNNDNIPFTKAPANQSGTTAHSNHLTSKQNFSEKSEGEDDKENNIQNRQDSKIKDPCALNTDEVFAPTPLYPLPPQTPAAFRALRLRSQTSKTRPSPFKENPRAHIKEQFAQALLDEEVSLLTCRVVRPSTLLLPKPLQDPVAKSLSGGDATHFVPILKTPSSTPKHARRSSFGGSAFSKFLRS